MNKIGMLALAAALLAQAATAAESGAVSINGAWVRALPPGQANTAAYMRVTNPTAATVTVVGASAEIATKTEIHTTLEVDGYMRMQQLEQLSIAPGQELELAPGGSHLMLLGLDRMPEPGETVSLCLQLAAGEDVCTAAPVRKSAGTQSAHHQHHKQ